MQLLTFIKTLKQLVFWEKDDDFFDKEATIKEYFAVCPPEKRRKVESYDELYKEALKFVGKQCFRENTQDQEDYFYELDKTDACIAILTGVFAYKIAYVVDKNGKKIEQSIDKILKDYDKNNPFDTKIGKNHRNHGHDIFTFALKNIPSDYPIATSRLGSINEYRTIGDVVGSNSDNISMMQLIWHYYGKSAKNPLYGIFNCVGHTIVHFAKDLLTSDGVPLPFSSLFNEYICLSDDDEVTGLDSGGITDKDDYILENKFNDKVNEYNGNMKASDFASLGFINGMCKLYSHSKKIEEKEESFNRDLKIMAMATCIMIQMSSLIFGEDIRKIKNPKAKGNIAKVPGAKLNVIMTGALFKNMVKEMLVVIKARNEVNLAYDMEIEKIGEEYGKYQ